MHINAKTCFVISRIGEPGSLERTQADFVLDKIIKPVTKPLGIKVKRADREAGTDRITERIVSDIEGSDICIVDLSGGNPNVYYECGRRHQLGGAYIHLCLKGEKLPFDIADFRAIQYSLDLDGLARTRKSLREFLLKEDRTRVSPRSINFDKPEMVEIKGGGFRIGSPSREPGRTCLEDPKKEVEVANFYIGAAPITFSEYDAFCDETTQKAARRPRDEGWGRGDRPVINVSWVEADKYCQWLAARTGRPYRLPTEVEWEYACRAGTKSAYSCGTQLRAINANFSDSKIEQTTSVRAYPANPWGLYDMHGNVWEWVADDWFDNYQSPAFKTPRHGRNFARLENRPHYPSHGKTVRGGSFYESRALCRSAARVRYPTIARVSYIGFRVACDAV